MVSEREVLEMNARAVAIMQIYRDGSMTPYQTTQMVAELRAVAAWFVAAKLSELELLQNVFEPIEAEFLDRYGRETGQQINTEFTRIFRRKLVALAKAATTSP